MPRLRKLEVPDELPRPEPVNWPELVSALGLRYRITELSAALGRGRAYLNAAYAPGWEPRYSDAVVLLKLYEGIK